MKKTNFITSLFFFSQLAFGGINTQIKSEAKQEAPQADAAIVFIDGQASCLTFSENASADWQDIVQDESGLELCSEQQNSQEVQGFVQSFQNDTIAEDSQYAFWSYAAVGAFGCAVGATLASSISSDYNKKTALELRDMSSFFTGGVVGSLLAGAITATGAIAAIASSIVKVAADVKGHVAATTVGAMICYGGVSAILLEDKRFFQTN